EAGTVRPQDQLERGSDPATTNLRREPLWMYWGLLRNSPSLLMTTKRRGCIIQLSRVTSCAVEYFSIIEPVNSQHGQHRGGETGEDG
ncbi:hypothetical protein KUCAC02_003522, partial [Chaenocephalus aceratus]